MRRPYAAPRIMETVGPHGVIPFRSAQGADDFAAFARAVDRQYHAWMFFAQMTAQAPEPTPEQRRATARSMLNAYPPARRCDSCGCDGQRGSFHGGGDGD